METYVAAVDLGASSGRVLLGKFVATDRRLFVEEVHRFENGFVRRNGHDCWDLEHIVSEILCGLERIIERGIPLASVGIDTWGVDFVLLNEQNELLGEAVSYRDHRTSGVLADVLRVVSREEIYQRTGIQFLRFNTLYQLVALIKEAPEWLPHARKLAFIPDYLHYRLCGRVSCEYTNASTSQLLSLASNTWDFELIEKLRIPQHWFQPLSQPGTTLGYWSSRNGTRVVVTPPATHDTGSAVYAVPFSNRESAFISSGTWSLMGIEADHPFTGDFALQCNITNEGGADGTYRVLKNIMGLWLIQRVRDAFPELDFWDLAALAKNATPLRYLINPNDDRFLNPSSMAEEIREFCMETGQGTPSSAGEFARCVFESLALLYRTTLIELERVSGLHIRNIHIVGGGCQNQFLNQLCADFCQLPVITGPIEASALGNITCQLRASGCLSGLEEARQLIASNFPGDVLNPDAGMKETIEQHWLRFKELCEHHPAHPEKALEGAVS